MAALRRFNKKIVFKNRASGRSKTKKWKSDQKTDNKYIVFVWSQYDGAIIEQRIIGYGWRQNQEAKLKILGGDLLGCQ